MPAPLICIRMPSRNHASFAERALASIFSQDWPNLCVVVCNDASTDNTLAVLENLTRKFDFVLLNNEQQLGLTGTLNRITEACPHADFYFNFATDDLLEPGALRAMAECLLTRPKAAASGGWFRPINVDDDLLSTNLTQAPEGWLNPINWANHSTFLPQAWLMIRGDWLRRMGPYPEDIRFEDLYLILWVFSENGQIYSVGQHTVRYRKHGANVSGNNPFMAKGILYTCSRFLGSRLVRKYLRHNYHHQGKHLVWLCASIAAGLPCTLPTMQKCMRWLAKWIAC